MATHLPALETTVGLNEPFTKFEDLAQPVCPMAGLLESLTRPWTLHILWQLSNGGPMRFGALRRSVTGISARLLTLRLRALEAEGFVRRTVMGGKVPEVIYAPTARLADMNEVMAKLHALSVKWRHEDNRRLPAAELRNALRHD